MAIFKPLKLDVDIVADRRRESEAAELQVSIPDDIRMGSSIVIEILNHEAGNEYDISFSHGTFTYREGFIRYEAPLGYYGKVTLTVSHANGKPFGYVVFDDGTVYDENGKVEKLEIVDGQFTFNGQTVNLEEVKKQDVGASLEVPPVPTNTDTPLTDSALDSFNVSAVFGELGGKELNRSLIQWKNGEFSDYFLPTDEDKASNESPNLYRVRDGVFQTVPRNSNVKQSGGNIFSGYGSVGDVGGSLTVMAGDVFKERTQQWVFEIVNNELEAIMPDDVTSICLTNIVFEPILKGNPDGHTFLWEQIKGDDRSVTWLSDPKEPRLVLDLGSVKTDRVFRFWISKGTRYEKFYDVTIYGTPREHIKPFSFDQTESLFQNYLNINTHSTKPILLWYENIWNKSLRLKIKKLP